MADSTQEGIVPGAAVTSFAPGTTIIEAHDLELRNLIGCPYSGVSLQVKAGQLFAVRGRNGSGKSALLLTLAGRMVFTKGRLEILGYRMPRRMGRVHKRIALGLFEGLNDLPEPQLVRNAVAAEFALRGRSAKRSAVNDYLAEWGLTEIADSTIGSLTREQLVALGVQLAWVGHPDIIVVDDIESGLTLGQSIALMQRLSTMAHDRNVTILVGVMERGLASMADAALYLEDDATPIFVADQAESEGDGDGDNNGGHNKDNDNKPGITLDEPALAGVAGAKEA